MPDVWLMRHPPVAEAARSLCYGQCDVPLADEQFTTFLDQLPPNIAHLYHSGLSRTARLAAFLGRHFPLDPIEDHRLRERNFGEWEGVPWDQIHANTGDAMMGMIRDPEHWRPPGGETTYELRDRVRNWYAELPHPAVVLAITHGGPIAALQGSLWNWPVSRWLELIPSPGQLVLLRDMPSQ